MNNNKLEEVYKNRKMRNHFNNSILVDGYLYGFDGNSNLGRLVKLVCMDFLTGRVAWKEPGFGCGSLMVADGKLLILTEAGTKKRASLHVLAGAAVRDAAVFGVAAAAMVAQADQKSFGDNASQASSTETRRPGEE